jgi:hypothetical protein
VFELTGSLTYVMPIMLSILISKWVSEAISQQGIYDLVINLNQHPYLDSKKRYIFTSTFADLCTPQSEDSRNCIDVTNGGKDIAAGGLREKVDWLKEVGGRDGGFCIVKEEVLLGYISASELEYALGMISSPFQLFQDKCHLYYDGCPADWSLGFSVSFTYGYLDQIADDEAMCTFMPLHESMRGSCLDELPRSPALTDLRPYIDQVYTSPNVALSGDIF